MELEYNGQRIALSDGELVIGSDPKADLVLDGIEPRHAAVKRLGERMATIIPLAANARVLVNGVASKREAMPLLHGDVVRLGDHELRVVNPAHPTGSPGTPPVGGRERLHDTLFGVPRRSGSHPAADGEKGDSDSKRVALEDDGRLGVLLAGLLSLTLLLVLLFR